MAIRLKDYRRNNFEVDRLLAKWDYSGAPYHPENKREFRRIPTRPDFYTSEEATRQTNQAPLAPKSPQADPSPTGIQGMTEDQIFRFNEQGELVGAR